MELSKDCASNMTYAEDIFVSADQLLIIRDPEIWLEGVIL